MRSGWVWLQFLCLVMAGCVAAARDPVPKGGDIAEIFPCYPAQRLYTEFSPVESCPGIRDVDEKAPPPDLIFRVSKTGRVLDAYSVARVPPGFDSCLLIVGRSLAFEPARTCDGAAVAGLARVAYRDVFPFPSLKAE